jgi:hypothetical protein
LQHQLGQARGMASQFSTATSVLQVHGIRMRSHSSPSSMVSTKIYYTHGIIGVLQIYSKQDVKSTVSSSVYFLEFVNLL